MEFYYQFALSFTTPDEFGRRRQIDKGLASDNTYYVRRGFAFLMVIKMETLDPVTENQFD